LLPFENVDVNGSVRVENISDLSLTELLPQFAINYSPIRDLYFGGAYSKSFHAPTLNDLYWSPGGNAKLNPERGENWQSSISYEQEWNSFSAKFSATGFLAHIDNEIIWQPYIGTEWTPVNVGEVESKGIEVRANGDLRVNTQLSLHVEE